MAEWMIGPLAGSETGLVLAQADGVGVPGTDAPPATDGSTGGTNGTGQTSQAPFGGDMFFIIMIGMMVFFVFAAFLGPRKEKKRHQAMLASIKKHDRVQTLGGVVGSVVDITDTNVVLKVDESSNTRITFAKNAIQHVLGDEAPGRG